jgi:hypothetical protein
MIESFLEEVNKMEDEDIQEMTYSIAEVLNENGIDARQAEPILWTLLSIRGGYKFRILLCSTIILPAAILTYLLLTAADSDKAQAYALTTKFPSRTSDDILAKVLTDKAIQALQNGNRTTAIKYMIAADQELNSGKFKFSH